MTNADRPEYPTRPPYFAHRFCRLLFRTGAAAEIGTNATLLLVNIAHTEDAKRYAGAVRFYAANLADQCGFSVSSMERARAAAVKAGWLHYRPGAKGRMASYWVLIPERLRDTPDDHGGEDLPRQVDGACDGHPRVFRQPDGESDGASGEHVTDLLPSPFPSSGKSSAAPPPAGDAKTPAKVATTAKDAARPPAAGPHAEAVAEWCAAWRARYAKAYSFTGQDGAAVKWMLGELGGDVARFRATVARYLACRDEFLTRREHPLAVLRSQFNTYKPPDPDTRLPPARASDCVDLPSPDRT
jgi:hypothetical protein